MRVLSTKEGKAVVKPADEQLLRLMCEEGDKPLKFFGKKLRCTPEAISYRITQLEQRGIIQGYRGVFNLRKLNYLSYHIFVRLLPTADRQVLLKRLTEAPEVNAVLRYSGNRDLEVSILARSPEEFDAVSTRLFAGVGVQEYDVTMLLRTVVSRVIPGQKLGFLKIPHEDFVPDAMDVKIAEFYSSNAHTPYLVAAREMELTYDIVRYRVKRMKDAGFFIETRPVLNYEALGYQVYSVLLSFRPSTIEEERRFEETLRQNDNVLWCTKILGRWNYLVYVIVPQDRELHRLLEDMRKGFGIIGVELYPVSEELKYTFLPKGLLKAP